MENPVVADMESRSMLEPVSAGTIDALVESPGLVVLFFTCGGSHHRETHDVAVALREILKAYPGKLRAARVEAEQSLKDRFRVLTAPSLVFCVGGQVQEVLPGRAAGRPSHEQIRPHPQCGNWQEST